LNRIIVGIWISKMKITQKNNLDSSLLNPNPKINGFIQSVKYSNVVTNDYFIGSNSKYYMIWVLILAKLNQTHVHPKCYKIYSVLQKKKKLDNPFTTMYTILMITIRKSRITGQLEKHLVHFFERNYAPVYSAPFIPCLIYGWLTCGKSNFNGWD
jgi:hypothetical protein